ncbi:hypothetical protein GCM10020000_66070 [Streptomyces olivoverticillatus]
MTPATDVFALGATLAYAATADSPFGQGSSEVMLYRVVHEEPQLMGVPDALAPLIHACLAKDPEERPSTLQLSLRLKEIAAREAHGLTESRPRRRAGRRTGRWASGPPSTSSSAPSGARAAHRRRGPTPRHAPPIRGAVSGTRPRRGCPAAARAPARRRAPGRVPGGRGPTASCCVSD